MSPDFLIAIARSARFPDALRTRATWMLDTIRMWELDPQGAAAEMALACRDAEISKGAEAKR